MKLQILHCSAVHFEDEAPSTRPRGITPRQMPDIHIEPLAQDLSDTSLAEFIALFERIDLMNLHCSPMDLRRGYIESELGLDTQHVRDLFQKARAAHLLGELCIRKEHNSWIEHSKAKGCLVVMTCVEKGDAARDDVEARFLEEVMGVANAVTGSKPTSVDIVLVPNAHLAPGEDLETDSTRAQETVGRVRAALVAAGFDVHEASFGFGKRVQLTILGHPAAYVFRAV